MSKVVGLITVSRTFEVSGNVLLIFLLEMLKSLKKVESQFWISANLSLSFQGLFTFFISGKKLYASFNTSDKSSESPEETLKIKDNNSLS